MGMVEETGKGATNLQAGRSCSRAVHDRVRELRVLQEEDLNTNPNAHLMEAAYGYSGSGLFGYSHMMGGYAGGQAQYVRTPFANAGP
jgi:threonine dehydrogenase-like Zn-dependent dehydrogenase